MNEKSDEAGDLGADEPDERSEPPVLAAPVDEAFDTPPDEVPEEKTQDEAAPVEQRRGRPGLFGVLAALAFLLSLTALAGVGFIAWKGRDFGSGQANTDATVASLTDNLGESLETVDDLQKRLTALSESDAAYGSKLDALEHQLDSLLERYENIPPRLASLETAMSSLQGISTGVRDNWWLAEAEYYMQIANAQLQLAGNPRLARLALQFADERVRQLGNPALTDVRRALARELRALESMEKPDIEGATMQLASLADTVRSLPIKEDVTRSSVAEEPADTQGGAFDRAMTSMKRAFGEVVSVRRTDEELRPLLSPEARYFLRANLALQMQTARLALLRGEKAVFEQSLKDARDWLEQYYDTDSAAVTSALATIADVGDSYVTVEPPDISQSLKLLRQYRELNAAELSGNAGERDTADSQSDQNAQ